MLQKYAFLQKLRRGKAGGVRRGKARHNAWRDTELTCFTGTSVPIFRTSVPVKAGDVQMLPTPGEILNLLALLVQKYTY